MGNERIGITKQTDQTLQHDQIRTGDVALLGNPIESRLDDVHHGTHMGIDEGQAGQLLLERPQGGQRLVGHFRFARVDAIPCLVRRTGNLSEKRFGEIFHFLVETGLHNGFRDGMIHERRNPIQLPGESHAGTDILGTHRGFPDNAGPLRMLVDPVFNGLVVIGEERILFLQEFITDAYEFPDDLSGLIFRDGPAGHEPDAVAIQIIEGTGFQSDENLEVIRISDALGTQRGKVFRGKFRAAEVFQHHLLAGRPETDVEIQSEKIVENLDVRKNGGIHDNSVSWLKGLRVRCDSLQRVFGGSVPEAPARGCRPRNHPQEWSNFGLSLQNVHRESPAHEKRLPHARSVKKPRFSKSPAEAEEACQDSLGPSPYV